MCKCVCLLGGRKRYQWRAAGAFVWKGAGVLLTSAYGDTARQQLLTLVIRTGRRLSRHTREDKTEGGKENSGWRDEEKALSHKRAGSGVRGLLVSLYLRVCQSSHSEL